MKKINFFMLYIRHISFLGFLWAGVILFPGFMSFELGLVCLGLFLLYSIVSIIMFFVKPFYEQNNILNNFVLCLLHFYFSFIAYKYSGVSDVFGVLNTEYFNLNFFVCSICMFVLTINKIILSNTK